MAQRYPQTAYAGFTQSLQSEWQYISRCVAGVEEFLQPVEDAIREYFLPAILQERADNIDDEFRTLLGHGVKQGGINVRNPTLTASRLFESSEAACAALVGCLLSDEALDLRAHAQCVRQASTETRKLRVEEESEFVKGLAAGAPKGLKRRLARVGKVGAWKTVTPSRLNGTLLLREEFFDNMRLSYGMRPHDLCERCDGCGAGFSVEHALSCKKGGLVCQRHDDARDEAGALCAMALTDSRVSYEPFIYYGKDNCANLETETAQPPSKNLAKDEARGDVAVHGLWEKGRTCILDIRITDTDAKSYQSSSSEKVLERCAKLKKDKYEQVCIERRRTFCPLVYSVDGMACKTARAFEKRVASKLATKMDRRYSEMVGFVRARMSLVVIRSNTLLLRGARVGRAFRPDIADAAAFNAMGGQREW